MNHEKHYVCSECGNVSKNPGTCQIDDCTQQGVALHECHCKNNKHESIVNQFKSSDENQEAEGSKINLLDLDSPNP
ncbi:MAG: hypothetical protein V4519_01420 [Patescibacteria group bacterium]